MIYVYPVQQPEQDLYDWVKLFKSSKMTCVVFVLIHRIVPF